MLASGSCLLTDIVDQLHEDFKNVNSVEPLIRHLDKGTPVKALISYLSVVRKWCPDEPVIHIDDIDIVKPDGYKFEALGIVRDSSRSTDTKNVYEKGYHMTEACVMTQNNHPVSIFQESIPQRKRTSTTSMMSPFLPWNGVQPCLELPHLSWTQAMMTTRCF